MLARYSIERGRKLVDFPARIRDGVRQDTRKHTRHPLRPDAEEVRVYLANPGASSWERFERSYRALLRERFAADRDPFDALAARARLGDVFLGCSCPTKSNPDVRHCHTTLALAFMREHYPDLEVEMP